MRGIPRGTIRPWDGSLISIRVELGQVGRASSAFVICKRSRVRGFAGSRGLSVGTNSALQDRPLARCRQAGEGRHRSGLR
jgi:hypothetical protein